MENLKIVTVQLREQRVSPQKARLVMDMIRNKNLTTSIDIVSNLNKKSALTALKLLKSALSAAKEKDYKEDDLFVCESLVNEGKKLKRYYIRARGRSTKYMKRSSHFKVSLCKINKENEIEKKENGKKD